MSWTMNRHTVLVKEFYSFISDEHILSFICKQNTEEIARYAHFKRGTVIDPYAKT